MTTDRLAALHDAVRSAVGFTLFDYDIDTRESRAILEAVDDVFAAAGVTVAAQPAEEDVSDALWAKWTGGERLAYSMGYRRGQAAQPAPDALRAAAQEHSPRWTDCDVSCTACDWYSTEPQGRTWWEHLAALRAALGDEP